MSGVFISARQRPPGDGPENRWPISNGPWRVALLTTPDAQPLDVAGPREIFSLAGRKLRELGDVNGRGYTVELLKIGKGRVITGESGLSLLAKHSYRGLKGPVDTLLITGGMEPWNPAGQEEVLDWIRSWAPESEGLARSVPELPTSCCRSTPKKAPQELASTRRGPGIPGCIFAPHRLRC